MVRYWCFVTSKPNWNICKKNVLWGVDYRYFITLNKFLRRGDRAVIYTHGGEFVAEVEVDGDWYYDQKHIGWTKNKMPYYFPYRIKIKIIKEGKLGISLSTKEENGKAKHTNPNPIDEILFIADKGKTWNIYFQVSIISIQKEDFDYILNHLNKEYKNNPTSKSS